MTLSPADDAFRARLAEALPDAALREVAPRYLEEPRGRWHGKAGVVVAPATVDEVATAIRLAGEARVGVVPWGGGTGLVGGQIMPEGPAPMLLSLERMRAIRAVHAEEDVLVTEAGATVEAVRQAAEEAGRLFPLSYASQGTATIGAGLAVNSGGLNVLRYGTARALCLGIEAVLPDGSVMHGLKRLRKDNTGYDIRDLLIGAEGTLGVITAAALTLAPRPVNVATAFLAVPDPDAGLTLLGRVRDEVGEAVSAFELVSGTAFGFLSEALPDLRQPFDTAPAWAVLVEIGAGPGLDAEAALLRVVERAMEDGLVMDGRVAQSEGQRAEFWSVRESVPEANRRIGAIASHDIALPLSAVPVFLAEAEPALAQVAEMRINAFGHLGDGNLHYNLFPAPGRSREDYASVRETASRVVHDIVAAHDGSFSAEHGVGRLKVGDLERYGDPARLTAMRAIKAALDPLGIMNPGAVLR